MLAVVDWAGAWVERLGGQHRKVDIGSQQHPSGVELPLPPIILASFGADPAKRTVCVYGSHCTAGLLTLTRCSHLDVQPAEKVHMPSHISVHLMFGRRTAGTPTPSSSQHVCVCHRPAHATQEIDGVLWGRGATDDKVRR